MGFLISHNYLDNCGIVNNNMYNFWEYIGKPLDSGGYTLEGFSINAPITNAVNAFKDANIVYNKESKAVIDFSSCTNIRNCFNNVSYGSMSYVDKIILNTSKLTYTKTNDFMRNANMHVNELCILGSTKFTSNENTFNGTGVTADHIFLQTGGSNVSLNYINGWRYCVHGDGCDTFSIRSKTHDDITRTAGVALIGGIYDGTHYHTNGLIMHWGSSPSNTPVFGGAKVFSVYNTNKYCTADIGNYLYVSTDVGSETNWGTNGLLPSVQFDNYDEWNDPNGIDIRSNIDNKKYPMTSMVSYYAPYSGSTLSHRWLEAGDIAPICGKYTTTMDNAFYNCRGIRSLSPVCGPNVTSMVNTYRNCHNMPGPAACGPNVKTFVNTYANCTNINKAVCGDNVTYMNNAYYGCTSIEEAACGENVIIMDNAYRGCTSLKTAVVGPNVGVMNYAYAGCTSLTTACDGAGVGFVENAYLGCTSLTKFVSRVTPWKDSWWGMWGSKCGIPKELWDTLEYEYIPPNE